MIVLSVLVAVLVAALLAQAAFHASALRSQAAGHAKERSNLVAALIARTPGEYAGLVAAAVRAEKGTRKRPAEPAKDDDLESRIPMGL